MVEIHDYDLDPLINAFSEGICYLNAQGELLYYNQTALAHWNAEQTPDTLANTLSLLSPLARGLAGEVVNRELLRMNDAHALLISVIPLFNGTDEVHHVIVISLDVSESARMERQAQDALQVFLSAVLDTQDIGQIDEALRRMAVLIPQLEPVDNSIAFRLEGSMLIPVAIYGPHAYAQQYEAWYNEFLAQKKSIEDVLPQSAPAYLHALRMGRPVMVDFTGVPAPFYSNPRNLQAAIYAPVLLQGRVAGLLGAEIHRPERAKHPFPQWSIDLLTALARLASMSLEKTAFLSSNDQLREEIQESRALLAQKEEFLLLAAHELKNPLTTVSGMAQIVQRRLMRVLPLPDGAPSQEQTDLLRGLEHIRHQAQRIEHMITTMLQVSRVELDRLDVNLQDLDLAQLILRTLKGYMPFARNHELRLIVNGQFVDIDASSNSAMLPIYIQGDPQLLEQVLINLLSNAVRYSPQGGPITAFLRQTRDNYIELAVEDQGIGIPSKDLSRLVERYYRAENAQNISSQGLGLGLYLVNIIVARHHGTLIITSEGLPGKGSTFTIRLPAQNQ